MKENKDVKRKQMRKVQLHAQFLRTELMILSQKQLCKKHKYILR